MNRVSLIAAGVLAFGWTAARAEVGTTTDSSGATDATRPPPTNVDVNVNPPPAGDVDVNVNPPATNPTPPAATAPGSVEATPTPPANVDINVNPSPPPPPVAAPTQREAMPPAKVIDSNTAAQYGAVNERAVPVEPLPQPDYYRPGDVMHDTSHTWTSNVGAGFLVGGGFEDFTNSNLRSMTGGGGTWNARAIAGTHQYVGVEAAYVGSARSVDALGVQSNAVLLANGVEGALRVNIPVFMRRAQLLEPFGFVGLGWSHYSVTNTNTNTSDLAKDDDIMSVPVGGGLEYAIGRFMADARFTYRSTYYNDLMRTGGNLNNWGVSSQIGVSF